jgi:hypothetical protein
MRDEVKDKNLKLQIKLDDETSKGMYVNLALVNHTQGEFTIDAMYVQPQQPLANVRARLISSPHHTKRLLRALQENVRKYEERFGPIELQGPDPADQLLQ